MDEDDYGYEEYEASPYNGDDLDGGYHDGHWEGDEPEDLPYNDDVDLDEAHNPYPWEDEAYEN